MDLKQLETFVHVAEFGSFTRAAGYLSVVQPALSRQVRQLEVELRQTLFDRNGRGVTPTDAGRRLLEHARGILLQVERARVDMEEQRGAAAGQLAVGLPPSVGRTLTAPLVLAFRERFPRATLSLVEGLSTQLIEWLAVGRIDCAVVYDMPPAADVDLLPVLDEPLFLVSARRSGVDAQREVGPAVTLAALAQIELVMPRRPNSIRMLLETALAAQGLRAQVGLEIDSVPAILDLVSRGAYDGVLTRNAVRTDRREDGFALRPIATPGLQATMSIATFGRRSRGPLLDRSMELLREMLTELWKPVP